MFPSRAARTPGARALVPVLPLLAAAALLCGCAKQPNGKTAFIWPGSEPMQVAAAPPPAADIEDDGREAQLPPLKKRQTEPDDPTQPWSPNYGRTSPPQVPAQERTATVPAIPADLPPAFRRRLAGAMQE